MAPVDDVADDRIEIAKDIDCRDTEGRDATLRQPCVSALIALRSVAHVVRHAIDFDRKNGRFAVEIQHKRTGRVLTSEFQIGWPLPQLAP